VLLPARQTRRPKLQKKVHTDISPIEKLRTARGDPFLTLKGLWPQEIQTELDEVYPRQHSKPSLRNETKFSPEIGILMVYVMTQLSAFHQLVAFVGDNAMHCKVEWHFESTMIGKESLYNISQ
jgi:hypothetical protein